MRSLVWKLAFAFWLVSLIGIVFVALIAGQIVQRESAEFENRFNRDVVTERLASFYEDNDGWPRRGVINGPPQRGGVRWVVLDEAQEVVLTSHRDIEPITDSDKENATDIVVDGDTIGQLIIVAEGRNNSVGREISAARQLFTNAVNRSLILSSIAATVIALLLGVVFSRRLTRPIKELTVATKRVAQGNLDEAVTVRSEDEIGELSQAFNQMGRDLAASQQARRQMTADIAHDLRTPLSVIRGHAEGLKDGVLPPTEETFSIIHDESLRLNRLIEDLRTLSLADAGELPLSLYPVAPTALLKRAVAAHAPLAEDQSVTLSVEADARLPELNVDADRIAQVLDNLLGNALRHTPAGGRVVVGAAVADDAVALTVRDNGEGISAEDLPNIFNRFYRADKSRQRADGGSRSGLGLAISKSVVEQHGGQLTAKSELGNGTIFTITLPVAHRS